MHKPEGGVLAKEQLEQFQTEGYLVLKGLFKQEADELRDHFMKLYAGGPIPGCFNPLPLEQTGGDNLKAYPRMMHPHRIDETSMNYMLHPKVMNVLADLYGEEPLAAQSMFYFKPPGAKGQALHQDNFYLKVEPGTCIAAWTAIDAADEENGGLFVVPESNRLAVECPQTADPNESFTKEYVPVPAGYRAVPVRMEAGDVLFFNGSVIHGSYPNKSEHRFRRAFICHYANASTAKIATHYKPLYRWDGMEADGIQFDNSGGPCGTEHLVAGPH